MNHTNSNGNRLDALKQREAKLRAALAVERVRLQKKKEKNRERLVQIVGAAVLTGAARVPEFEATLRRILGEEVTDERERTFLAAEMGWE